MVFIMLVGMKIVICFYGCDVVIYGYLLKMIEIVVILEGIVYVICQVVYMVFVICKVKKVICKVFENLMNGKGFNLVEIVLICNFGWKMIL